MSASEPVGPAGPKGQGPTPPDAPRAEGERPHDDDWPTQASAPEGLPPAGFADDPTVSRTADAAAALRAEAAEAREKLLRTAAEFDNFRKRTRRDLDEAERRGRESLLRDLLPVFDNLERALLVAHQATDVKAVADGVGMVLKQFTDTLERGGIRRVPTTGAPFDPQVHEAIQQVETADQPPGSVVAEVRAGYAMGERLVRAAMVVVAKAPSGG
ncbi:MAG TPA: nucleotide exchange factor GrpE [Polyangiaceae bacterium]|nr:nucleotide exchange factor GrpE [Polyangiaceae bacterium]